MNGMYDPSKAGHGGRRGPIRGADEEDNEAEDKIGNSSFLKRVIKKQERDVVGAFNKRQRREDSAEPDQVVEGHEESKKDKENNIEPLMTGSGDKDAEITDQQAEEVYEIEDMEL